MDVTFCDTVTDSICNAHFFHRVSNVTCLAFAILIQGSWVGVDLAFEIWSLFDFAGQR